MKKAVLCVLLTSAILLCACTGNTPAQTTDTERDTVPMTEEKTEMTAEHTAGITAVTEAATEAPAAKAPEAEVPEAVPAKRGGVAGFLQRQHNEGRAEIPGQGDERKRVLSRPGILGGEGGDGERRLVEAPHGFVEPGGGKGAVVAAEQAQTLG